MHVHQLQDLALSDHVRRIGQHFQHAHRPTDTIIWNAREYRKSPTSTLAAFPNSAFAVCATSTHRRLIHHIVVQQRGGVDEFNDRRQLEACVAVVTKSTGEQQHQARPDAFAAGAMM